MHVQRLLWIIPLSLSLVTGASARLRDGRMHGNMMRPAAIPKVSAPGEPGAPVTSRNGTILPPYNTVFEFDQLIDHNNPSLGTFKQRFWHTWEFYEQGGPIILMTPGETNADGFDGYLTNETINGLFAQQQNGSTVVFEHRFFGLSNPRPDLSEESLKLLTIQQAIDDIEYFTKNVNLPMPGGNSVTPDKTPWILTGASYPGALTSWTMVNKPGLFAAGYASSAVVEAVLDFWQYFEPIRQNMPQNCSADVQAVIQKVDSTLMGNNPMAIQALKDNWGLGPVTHLDDFAGALRNNMWDWQSMQVYSGPGAQFFKFCDALEVKNGVSAPPSGWGVDHAFSAWGAYWKSTYLNILCGGQDANACLGTYDTSQAFWTDTAIDNSERSWFWIVCNEVGFLQEGAPATSPTLVTRLVQPIYDLRQCQQMFPAAFSAPPTPNTALTNSKYHGWDVRINNLFFANAIRDPWRDATISSTNVSVASTAQQPIAVGDGFHGSDMITLSGIDDPTILAVQKQALTSIRGWLAAWKPQNSKPLPPPRGPPSMPVSPKEPSPPALAKPVNAWFKGINQDDAHTQMSELRKKR